MPINYIHQRIETLIILDFQEQWRDYWLEYVQTSLMEGKTLSLVSSAHNMKEVQQSFIKVYFLDLQAILIKERILL